MVIECSTTHLRDAVSKTQRFVASTTTLPILKNIFIIINNNTLTIRATNLDVGCEVQIPIKGKGSQSITVPPGVLNQTLSVISDQLLQLKIGDNSITISTNNGVYTIQGQATEDFPTLPRIQGGSTLTLPVELFTQNTNNVLFAASMVDLKPEIASVYYSIKEGDFVCVATDGFRLAEKKSPFNGAGTLNHIIPNKSAQELSTIFTGLTGELSIQLSESECSFTLGTTHIVTRVVHGVYPDYPQLIPHTFETELRVQKTELLSALKVSTLYSEKTNHCSIRIDPSVSYCELESKNASVGEGLVKLQGELSGEPLELTINSRYLIEALSVIQQPIIFIGCNGRSKPLLVRGDGVGDFSYLLMPINR